MRTAEEILDKKIPFSECTEEEIAAVVEYKAAIMSRDSDYTVNTNALSELLITASKRFGQVAAENKAVLNDHELKAAARLDAALKLADEAIHE